MKRTKTKNILKQNAKLQKIFGKKYNVKLPRRRETTMWVIGSSIDGIGIELWDGRCFVSMSSRSLQKYTV